MNTNRLLFRKEAALQRYAQRLLNGVLIIAAVLPASLPLGAQNGSDADCGG